MLQVWISFPVVIVFYQVQARPLAYPEGIKPGDQISGSSGEFWRYKSVLVKPPDDEDRMEALKMSEDVKCAACEIILQRLMKRVESNSQDHIMDALDGEPDEIPELTGDAQEDRVNQNRRGCNKHFKDELLLRGYGLKHCEATVSIVDNETDAGTEEVAKPKTWCLHNVGANNVDSRQADTYSTRSEAVYHACENTIARHGHEIADFLSQRLEEGGDVNKAIKEACLEAAFCDGTRLQTSKREKAAASKSGKKKRRKKREEDESMWDIMNEQREEEEKQRRRRRRRKVTKSEL
jgi:hypothetical protein|mmetsp:Transcript_62773/g.99527  ORF Transcript_62773/g.99527 Transcript_62773/m.99527 type:complete len:293 (+) Transcript_62773:62-940(+)